MAIDVSVLMGAALQAAFVIGCTAVIGKVIPKDEKDVVLPLVALMLGVAAVTSELWMPTGIAELIMKGVALGGTATGLYAVGTGDGERSVEVRAADGQ